MPRSNSTARLEKNYSLQRVFLLPCLWAFAVALIVQGADAPADAPPARVMLELTNGSRIAGTPSIDRLKMATQYADVEFLLSRLRTLAFQGADRTCTITLQNGDLLKGKLAATEIAMKTLFGQVVIPLEQVSKIVGMGGKTMPEGLVLYYNFDADEGGRVTDSSGNGNDGKIHGATHISAGQVRGAMSFNGDGQMVIVGNPASLRLQNFTIMAWIKRGATDLVCKTSDWADLFCYCHGGYGFGIHRDGHLFLSKADMDSTFSAGEIHDQAFHHVAVTKQGSKVVFFLDGVAGPATDLNTDFEFDSDASVGGRTDSFQTTFLGVIDEVAVFNRPLSDEEVKDIYESQK